MYLIKYITVTAVLFMGAFISNAQEKPGGTEKEGKITPILWEDGVENAYPRWSNDGNKILYQSNRTGTISTTTTSLPGRRIINKLHLSRTVEAMKIFTL